MTSVAQSTRRKSATQTARSMASRPAPAAQVETAAPETGILAATELQRQALQRLERLCEESVRFASTRLEENRSTMQELVACRSLPDSVSVWTRHVERTVKQYSEKLGTLTELCTAQTRETVQETAGAAQASLAASPAATVAEVAPSPMAEAIPPQSDEVAAAGETAFEAATEAVGEAADRLAPETALRAGEASDAKG